MGLRAHRGKFCCPGVRTGEAYHPMARADQVLNDGFADEACRTRHKNTHEQIPG
jgi:hypothetical protein